MGSSRAPESDPAIGQAAMLSAQTGQQTLDHMRQQAAISNTWAAEDRHRYQSQFVPLQDQFINEAQNYDTPERREAEVTRATADVRQQGSLQRGAMDRSLRAQGVRPGSGRQMDTTRRLNFDEGLAAAGAGNIARRRVESEGRNLRAQAVNMGSGLAVNPGTSLGMASSAIQAGGAAAQNGFAQQGQLLGQDHQRRLQSWQASNQSRASLGGALGSVFGAAGGLGLLFSDEDAKEDIKPSKKGSHLRALRKMPVKDWKYKDGEGPDTEQHTGTMAQDFQEATGKGDGRTIPAVDAVGTIMGAVQDLDENVRKLERKLKKSGDQTMRKAA